MSRSLCACSCAALMALALSTSLAAQPATPADPNIVVTEERAPPTEREIADQARHISIVGSPLDEPLPRFEDRLCPGVLGLKADAAAFIIERIRYNAEQFNLRLAEDDGTCEPNLIVAFVDDAQNQLVELARNNGYMLAGMSVSERGELLEAPGAARVWTNTAIRTNTGMPAPARASMAPERSTGSNSEDGASFSSGMPPASNSSASHSRIYFATREDIISVMILFDRAQVRGKSLLQLADYATMRGFAFTRETRGEVPAATILSLFDGDGPKPGRLTAFDLGYLGSLYQGLPNLPAASKIGDVAAEMERQQAVDGG